MEDTTPAFLQENHVAQILIFYAKSKQKMNGMWQNDILSGFLRDCCLAESRWLFPGRGMVVCGGGGGRFPLARILSISNPCFMQSHTKPGPGTPHSVLADDMALEPPPARGSRGSCLAYGACWFGHLGQAEPPFPLLPTHKGCDASCEPQVFPVAGSTLLWCQLQDGMFFPYELYNWLWRRVLHSFLCLSYWKFPLGEGGESLMGSRQ